jgi:short subunit dehydrogenase-like uncharacterized protein
MQFYINLNTSNNFLRFNKKSDPDSVAAAIESGRVSSGGRAGKTMNNSKNDGVAGAGDDHEAPASGHESVGADKSVKFNGTTNQLVGTAASGSPPPEKHSNHHRHRPPGRQSDSVPSSSLDAKNNSEQQQQKQQQRRPYDVVIFGASSSVGRFLVEEMALVIDKHYSNIPSQAGGQAAGHQLGVAQQNLTRRRSVPSSSINGGRIRWAVAGRSAVRLSETLCRAELSTGIKNLSNSVPIILADLNHQRSLLDMCNTASVIINCVGPYSELGAEILIKACIECATNYIDLAHETTFVETINQRYSEPARQRGVFILNGCGFQSMSAEMGLNFTKQVADGRIEQVKIILSLSDTKSIARISSRSGGIVTEGMWNALLTEKAQEVSLEERLRSESATCLSMRRSSGDQQHDRDADSAELDAPTSGSKPVTGQTKLTAATTSSDCDQHGDDDSSADGPGRKLLQRKDTRSLVTDIVQFRNRNVTKFSWPLQFIRNVQSQRGRGFCWPIDNLTSDESQLIRGEMNNYELRRPDLESSDGWRPIRCTTFVSVKHFTHLCMLFAWIFVFEIVVKFSLGRYLMRKVPGLASFGHVSPSGSSDSGRWFVGGGLLGSTRRQQQQQQPLLDRDSLNHIKFCQTFIAYGTPSEDSGDPLEDRRRRNRNCSHVQLLVARVVGPEPNHVTTATLAVQAALTVLTERDHLPGTGGVLTPGAAFSETNIIYHLRRRNIKFEVLKKA